MSHIHLCLKMNELEYINKNKSLILDLDTIIMLRL